MRARMEAMATPTAVKDQILVIMGLALENKRGVVASVGMTWYTIKPLYTRFWFCQSSR